MVVRGSCSCYGHASRCLPQDGTVSKPDMVYGQCECTHNTKGLNCEACEDFFNDFPWKPAIGRQTNACRRKWRSAQTSDWGSGKIISIIFFFRIWKHVKGATVIITPRAVTMTLPCSSWPAGRAAGCATDVRIIQWDVIVNNANSTSTKILRNHLPTAMFAYVRLPINYFVLFLCL